jgi:hypothetical protein
MAARVIRADDADYSFLIKQCSPRINCYSARVWFAAIRPTAGPAKRASTAYPAAGVKGLSMRDTGGLADDAPPARAVGTDNTPTKVGLTHTRGDRGRACANAAMPEPSPDRLGRPDS